jgi:hypothetical protein
LVATLADPAPPAKNKPKNAANSKTNYATAFFDSIGHLRKSPVAHGMSVLSRQGGRPS